MTIGRDVIRKMHIFTRAISVMLLMSLAGCIEMHTTVEVHKDGSGTIEQKVLYTGMLRSMMDGAMQSGKKESLLPDRKRLDSMASDFGPEVRLKRVSMISKGNELGYQVTFTYPDVEKIRIGNSLQENNFTGTDSTGAVPDNGAKKKQEVWFTFGMKRGPQPELTVLKQTELMHSPSSRPDSKPMSEKDRRDSMAMAKPFLKDMKMVVDLVVDGQVTSSDASHRTGNRFTLFSVEFDKLLEQPDIFSKKYEGLSDIELLKKIGPDSGLTLETKKRVAIGFN